MRLMVGATANAVREKILTELAQIARARGRAYLLVPEQFTMQTDRALLERLDVPVMMDIKVKSFGSLSREVLGRVGGAKLAYVNESGRRMLAQYLLGASREGLTILGKSWDKRGAAASLWKRWANFAVWAWMRSLWRSLAQARMCRRCWRRSWRMWKSCWRLTKKRSASATGQRSAAGAPGRKDRRGGLARRADDLY